MLFVWDKKFNLGVDELDQDHRKLVALINDLYEAMQDGCGGAALLPILSALRQYTETHFAREESFMVSCNAPDQEHHLQEHQHMIAKLADLESRHRSGEAAVSLQALTFLRDWLQNHICVIDQAMTNPLKSKETS